MTSEQSKAITTAMIEMLKTNTEMNWGSLTFTIQFENGKIIMTTKERETKREIK